MNILDFWSGGLAHASANWSTRGWSSTIHRVMNPVTYIVKRITCFDPVCIAGTYEFPLWPELELHGTSEFEHVVKMPQYDAICLLHPNPATTSNHLMLPWDEGFHTHRYITVVSQLVERNLKPGGHVIVQFDDEMRDFQQGKWREIFLDRLLQYTHGDLKKTDEWGSETQSRFHSDVYRFDSLHLLQKKS